MAWQCTERVHYHKWRLSFLPTASADHRSVGMPEEQRDSEMECGGIQSPLLSQENHLHHLQRNWSIHYSSVKMQVAIRWAI